MPVSLKLFTASVSTSFGRGFTSSGELSSTCRNTIGSAAAPDAEKLAHATHNPISRNRLALIVTLRRILDTRTGPPVEKRPRRMRRSYLATTLATSAPLGTLSAGTMRQSAPAGLAVGPLSSV